jgi:hypothetical protein
VSEISELEMKLRRKFYEDTDKHIAIQLELSQSRYLLRRIAGWTANPMPDQLIRYDVEQFLLAWDHKPADLAQGQLDTDGE